MDRTRLFAATVAALALGVASLGTTPALAQTKGPHGPFFLMPPIGHGVLTWGGNGSGQLGDSSTQNRATPVVLQNFADGALSVSGGGGHTLLQKADGTAWAVGSNTAGQLGTTSSNTCFFTACSTTVLQVGNLSGVMSIAAGAEHSIAIKNGNTVVAWGKNDKGQLGDGTNTPHQTPAAVNTLSNIIAIAAGGAHSLALRSDGTVWAWGDNALGQLGDSTTMPRSNPVQVVDDTNAPLTQVTKIAAAGDHSVALKSDGTVWVWGVNADAFGSTRSLAHRVQDLSFQGAPVTSIIAIATGGSHDLALKSDGTIMVWGSDNKGQLGDGGITNTYTTFTHFVKTNVNTGFSGVIAIAAGGTHSLALKSDGTVWAWGDNTFGALGTSTGTCNGAPPNTSAFPCSTFPVQVSSLSGVLSIAAGGLHSIAIERARASLSATSLTFPDTKINTSSGSQTVTLTNSGPGPIGIAAVTLSGPFTRSATGFPNACGTILAQGQTCRVDVNFTPTSAGPQTGTLSVLHDGFGAVQTISLSGRGIAPVASVSPTSLTFGAQQYQTAGATQRVTFTNSGDANLVFRSTAWQFNRPDFITTDYSVPSSSFTCVGLSTLAPGQSCYIDVAFYPFSDGTITGTLTFFHDAGSGSTTVNLSGTGLAPVASASPPRLDYDKVPLGSPSTSQTVTLTNTGTGNLHVKSTRGVYLSAPEPQEFWLLGGTDTCSGATLPPGSSCTVYVYFLPVRGPGLTSNASVAFDTDAGNGPQSVGLSGLSLPAQTDAAPRPVAFGTIGVGTGAKAVVRFTNTGSRAFVPSLSVDGPKAADFQLAPVKCAAVVNPGDACYVQVTFIPSVVGLEAVNLIVTDGSTGLQVGGVEVSGSGG